LARFLDLPSPLYPTASRFPILKGRAAITEFLERLAAFYWRSSFPPATNLSVSLFFSAIPLFSTTTQGFSPSKLPFNFFPCIWRPLFARILSISLDFVWLFAVFPVPAIVQIIVCTRQL